MTKEKLPFLLSVSMIAALIVASAVEAAAGAGIVRRAFYGAWWFRLLWGAIAVSGAWMCVGVIIAAYVLFLVMALLSAGVCGGSGTMLRHGCGISACALLSSPLSSCSSSGCVSWLRLGQHIVGRLLELGP